jgi:molybdenum cofactor cytidylyltransferase
VKEGRLAALILAAGESSRMGSDKALLLYRGKPFVDVIAANARIAGFSPVAVVLGHHARKIRRVARLEGVDVVINPEYRSGQTSSLQAGLRALEPAEADGVLFCLVDHPAVSQDVMQQLGAAYRRSHAHVVVPVWRGRHGHPILIGRPLFRELLELSPEKGADAVIREYRDATSWLELGDPSVLFDVDQPEDYERLLKE